MLPKQQTTRSKPTEERSNIEADQQEKQSNKRNDPNQRQENRITNQNRTENQSRRREQNQEQSKTKEQKQDKRRETKAESNQTESRNQNRTETNKTRRMVFVEVVNSVEVFQVRGYPRGEDDNREVSLLWLFGSREVYSLKVCHAARCNHWSEDCKTPSRRATKRNGEGVVMKSKVVSLNNSFCLRGRLTRSYG